MKFAVLVLLFVVVALQVVASAKEKHSPDRNKKPPVESEVSFDEESSEEAPGPPGKPNVSHRMAKSAGEDEEEGKWLAEVAKNSRNALRKSSKQSEAQAWSSGESSEESEEYDDDDGDIALVSDNDQTRSGEEEESSEEEPPKEHAHLHPGHVLPPSDGDIVLVSDNDQIRSGEEEDSSEKPHKGHAHLHLGHTLPPSDGNIVLVSDNDQIRSGEEEDLSEKPHKGHAHLHLGHTLPPSDGDIVLVSDNDQTRSGEKEESSAEPPKERAHQHKTWGHVLQPSASAKHRPGRLDFLRDPAVDYEDLEEYVPQYLELRAVPEYDYADMGYVAPYSDYGEDRHARGAALRLYVQEPDRDWHARLVARWLAQRRREKLLDLLGRRLRRRKGTSRGLGDVRRPVAFADNYLFSDEIFRLIRKHKHKLPETYYPSYETHPYPQHVQAANYTSYFDEYFKNKTPKAKAAKEAAALANKKNNRVISLAPRALFPFSP